MKARMITTVGLFGLLALAGVVGPVCGLALLVRLFVLP